VGINDAEGMAERIEYIYKNKKIREKAREYNLENIKNYSLDVVRIKMSEIYKEMLKN
jgi:glycosyltransferase involved in cell wall biosynthesis